MSKPRGPYRVDPLGYKKSQQALDKMAENARELGLDYEPAQQEFASPGGGYVPAIPAQRQALAEQPAQQCRTDGRCQYAIDSGAEGMGHCPKGKCIMPAQQEPVGEVGSQVVRFHMYKEIPPVGTKLYTSPPAQRTWVGLTDDELADFWFKQSLDWMEFARVIEDALRRKNETNH